MAMQMGGETHIAGLYLNGHLSDVTLYIGPSMNSCSKFPVHQLVLCAASPVFNAMFSGSYDENVRKSVLIKDIAPSVFHKLLMFLYTGVLTVTSLMETVDVLRASDKYDIQKLKSLCFEEISNFQMSLEDFWMLFSNLIDFGEQLTSRELKLSIFHYLDTHAPEIVKHGKFALLNRPTLTLVLSRNTFNIPEPELCDAVVQWSKIQCCAAHQEPTAHNQRAMLGSGIYEIRFLTLPITTLENMPIFGLLTADEKRLMTRAPDRMMPPWKRELMSRRRTKCWCLTTRANPYMSTDYSTTYFVFARDAYLTDMEIWLEDEFGLVTDVTICSLERDGTKMPVKISYNQHQMARNYKQQRLCPKPILNISSVFIKAFCCYQLVLEPKNTRAVVYEDDFDSYGYDEQGQAVFYSVGQEDVVDAEKFVSPDYWRMVFARKPPTQDENVVLGDVLTSSCILNVSAIFS